MAFGDRMKAYMANRAAKKEEQQFRQEQYGNRYAMSPEEQSEMNPERQNVQDAYLRESSLGEATGVGAMEQGFDPQNPESVLSMQRALNRAGFTDEEGQPLKEDSMMGPKTLSAIRAMQGGHRGAGASIDELQGQDSGMLDAGASTKSAEEIYSPEGRGKSRVPTHDPEGLGGWSGQTNVWAEQPITSKGREDVVGGVRSAAKGIDDLIEEKLPWLGGSGAYRGAKDWIKKGFGRAGNADY